MELVSKFGMHPSTYNTRQEKDLRDCLASMQGRHATVREVCAALEARGKRMGRTTVYRRLEALVAAGLARKFAAGPGGAACFAWTGGRRESLAGDAHAMCGTCGRVVHLRCGELAALGKHLAAAHRFRLDMGRTVLCGTCPDCQRRAAAGGKGASRR